MRPRSMAPSMWRRAGRCGWARSPPSRSSAPTPTTCTEPPSGFSQAVYRDGIGTQPGAASRANRIRSSYVGDTIARPRYPPLMVPLRAISTAPRRSKIPTRTRPEMRSGAKCMPAPLVWVREGPSQTSRSKFMNVTRRVWLGLLASFAVLATANLPAAAQQQQRKPNILVIMGDDVGWFNIGAYHRGIMSGKTPNLDKLASEGMLFTDYYAEASCTAGRA